MMLAAEQSGEAVKDAPLAGLKSVEGNKAQSQPALTKSSLTISSNSSGAADDQSSKRLSQYVANSKRCQVNFYLRLTFHFNSTPPLVRNFGKSFGTIKKLKNYLELSIIEIFSEIIFRISFLIEASEGKSGFKD